MSNMHPNSQYPNQQNQALRILVMGKASAAISNALIRMKSDAHIIAVDTLAEAQNLIRSETFDHVLVDNREDGTITLAIPNLAREETSAKITVLAGPQSAQALSAIPGIENVIVHPYNPVEIANSLGIDVTDSRVKSSPEDNLGRRESDEEVESDPNIRPYNNEYFEGDDAYKDDRSILIRGLIFATNLIPGLTPIASSLYKNLALVALVALFGAFVSYGSMIAYFLIATTWASPLQLQRGHELVIKAERERGELQVKRNLIKQQLADAQNKFERGRQTINRSQALASMSLITIDQEIANRNTRYIILQNEIEALQKVVFSYGSPKERQAERAVLERDYKRRVMTQQTYKNNLMNISEVERSAVSLNEQISRKHRESKILMQNRTYLTKLRDQLLNSDKSIEFIGGNAEFVPIANQVIEVQQLRANGKSDMSAYRMSNSVLRNSELVLTQSIDEIEATPMILALKEPLTILFVPYNNKDNFYQDRPLYSCAFAVFWCSKVGSVGKNIEGEIESKHPFFGKPIRGHFMEARLNNQAAAKEDIVFVGHPLYYFF